MRSIYAGDVFEGSVHILHVLKHKLLSRCGGALHKAGSSPLHHAAEFFAIHISKDRLNQWCN